MYQGMMSHLIIILSLSLINAETCLTTGQNSEQLIINSTGIYQEATTGIEHGWLSMSYVSKTQTWMTNPNVDGTCTIPFPEQTYALATCCYSDNNCQVVGPIPSYNCNIFTITSVSYSLVGIIFNVTYADMLTALQNNPTPYT